MGYNRYQCHILIMLALVQLSVVSSQQSDQYNKMMSPAWPDGEAVKVNVRFDLKRIIDMDSATQSVKVYGEFTMIWEDKRLPKIETSWKKDVAKKSWDEIWLPDLYVQNSEDDVTTRSLSFYKRNNLVILNRNGTVTAKPSGYLQIPCSLNMRKYPFDEHECEFSLLSSVYDETELLLEASSTSSSNDEEGNYGKFAVKSFGVKSDTSDPKGVLHYKIKFGRNSGLFRFGLVIPLALIGLVLTPVAFLLPPLHPSKLTPPISAFCLTTLILAALTLTVPSSGKVTPTIIEFTSFILLMSSLVIVLEWFIIWLHSPPRTPPQWVVKIMKKMGSCCCCTDLCVKNANTSRDSIIYDAAGQRLDINQQVDDDGNKKVAEDCVVVGRVLDRVFLILYLVIFVLMTGAIHAY